MTANKMQSPVMAHDPLADIDELSSAADDLLADGPDDLPELAGLADLELSEIDLAEAAAAIAEVAGPAAAPNGPVGAMDLGEVLSIREVGELHQQLLNSLIAQEGAEFSLDGGALQQIDGAGLQLLTAFVQELGRRGISCQWQRVSTALREGAETLGLVEALQLP
ncbi:MAG: STAS domain-containing protein [Gammaproteobacteria bacterium]|nr:STAS domain-containing protein [Gammaproteobacteria bacterium]